MCFGGKYLKPIIRKVIKIQNYRFKHKRISENGGGCTLGTKVMKQISKEDQQPQHTLPLGNHSCNRLSVGCGVEGLLGKLIKLTWQKKEGHLCPLHILP